VGLSVAVNLENWHRRLVGGFRIRGNPLSELTARIRTMAAQFTPPTEDHPAGALRCIAVENNAFGRFYELGLKRDTSLPLGDTGTAVKRSDAVVN
jgi:hypothetical protein